MFVIYKYNPDKDFVICSFGKFIFCVIDEASYTWDHSKREKNYRFFKIRCETEEIRRNYE